MSGWGEVARGGEGVAPGGGVGRNMIVRHGASLSRGFLQGQTAYTYTCTHTHTHIHTQTHTHTYTYTFTCTYTYPHIYIHHNLP